MAAGVRSRHKIVLCHRSDQARDCPADPDHPGQPHSDLDLACRDHRHRAGCSVRDNRRPDPAGGREDRADQRSHWRSGVRRRQAVSARHDDVSATVRTDCACVRDSQGLRDDGDAGYRDRGANHHGGAGKLVAGQRRSDHHAGADDIQHCSRRGAQRDDADSADGRDHHRGDRGVLGDIRRRDHRHGERPRDAARRAVE